MRRVSVLRTQTRRVSKEPWFELYHNPKWLREAGRSSSDANWAWFMIQRAFAVGGLMGITNGKAAGLVIVDFVKRQSRLGSSELQ
jgi:hypothetical protein